MIWACKTPNLDPAGVYRSNVFLYNSDHTLDAAASSLDAFVLWEMQNRASLASNHMEAVTVAADAVRTNAPTWFAVAQAARSAYTNLWLTMPTSSAAQTASNTLALQVISIQNQATAAKAVQSAVPK
jgi:hypothetical protein